MLESAKSYQEITILPASFWYGSSFVPSSFITPRIVHSFSSSRQPSPRHLIHATPKSGSFPGLVRASLQHFVSWPSVSDSMRWHLLLTAPQEPQVLPLAAALHFGPRGKSQLVTAGLDPCN